MLLSISLIILAGMLAGYVFTKMKIPSILGMLVVGIIFGPYVLNFIDPTLLQISGDLRQFALIIILLRAGFTMNREVLKQIGSPAILLSIIPAIFEIIAVTFFAHLLLNLSWLESAILGSVLGAVSPAVVVPFMINLKEKMRGTAKGIPSLLISASSIDDVFVIIIFTALTGIYTGSSSSLILSALSIPLSIILGCLIGMIIGLALVKFFKKIHIRDTVKVMIILSIAMLLTVAEAETSVIIPFSALLAIMAIGSVMLEKYQLLVKRMSPKFEKIWVVAQIFLFVLIGTEVNINVALDSGLAGLAVIIIGLVFRSLGVMVALIGSKFNLKEKLFIIIAYSPKATVQAAIAAIPLSLGISGGEIILAVAVLSILTTAPLGALGIELTNKKLLENNKIATTNNVEATE